MPDRVCLQPARAASGGMLRTAALLGGFTLGSRLLGLARDMGMAWLLGGGAAADALVAAMRLPHVLRRLLGEGSLSMTLTAGLVRRSHGPAGDAAEKRRAHVLRPLASALAVRLGLVLVVLTVAGLLAAPWLASALAPGFSGPETARAARPVARAVQPDHAAVHGRRGPRRLDARAHPGPGHVLRRPGSMAGAMVGPAPSAAGRSVAGAGQPSFAWSS